MNTLKTHYFLQTRGFEGETLYEIWLQRYIVDNAAKLGLTFIKYLTGKAGGGGDLKVIYQGKVEKAEVEWLYSDYNHQHNPKFKDTNILICLNWLDPIEEEKKKLPKIIIYIDIDDFSQWYHNKTGLFSKPHFTLREVKMDFAKQCYVTKVLESTDLKEIGKEIIEPFCINR